MCLVKFVECLFVWYFIFSFIQKQNRYLKNQKTITFTINATQNKTIINAIAPFRVIDSAENSKFSQVWLYIRFVCKQLHQYNNNTGESLQLTWILIHPTQNTSTLPLTGRIVGGKTIIQTACNTQPHKASERHPKPRAQTNFVIGLMRVGAVTVLVALHYGLAGLRLDTFNMVVTRRSNLYMVWFWFL